MQTQTIKLSGLTCPACKKVTEKRIGSIPSVTKVDVTVATGTATIESKEDLTALQINEVLKDTPYQVVVEE